jgi:hypothetical protein
MASASPDPTRRPAAAAAPEATTTANKKAVRSLQQHQTPAQRQAALEAHDAAMAELFPDVPSVLEFESWWNERPSMSHSNGGTGSEPMVQPPHRRYMLVRFFPETGQVEVQTDDAVVPLTIVVNSKSGVPLRCWDLHVGATIDILGRCTTLHAASIKTVLWLDENCRRLWRIKERMEHRVNRFRSKTNIALDYGVYKKLIQPSNGTKISLGGLACPGKVGAAILQIQSELAQFQ